MSEEFNQELIGAVGLLTVPISNGRPGEVVLPVRNGSEAFAAISDESIPKNTRVVVVDCLSGRTVSVTPL